MPTAQHDHIWHTNATDCHTWYARTGTWPSQHATDPRERRLGIWLRNQRHHHATGTLHPDRMHYLDTHLPDWDAPPTTVRDRWWDTAREVADWYATYRLLPRTPRADVRNQDERRLGRWLATQRDRNTHSELDPEQIAWLDTNVPGWHPTPGKRGSGCSEEWCTAADAYLDWYTEHGERPRRRGDTPEERRHANWFHTQRRARTRGTLHRDRDAWCAAYLPGWND